MTTSGTRYNRVLIINPFGIGDVLFTTPVITALKKHNPDAFIGYLCNKRAKPILEDNPNIGALFIYERDEFNRLWQQSKLQCFRAFRGLAKSIKKEKFDLAVDLSLGRPYNFFAWFIGIKKRIGFNYKNRGLCLTDKIDIAGYEGKHVIDFYLDLLRFLGVEASEARIDFFIAPRYDAWAGQFLKERGLENNAFIIGLIPGGGASWGKEAHRKHWPLQNFIELGKKLVDSRSATILVFGDSAEKPLCDDVAQGIGHGALCLAGQTDIKQFGALLKKCEVVIANDGGPLHVAVAVRAKTVSVFGPVDERVYGPYPKTADHIVVTKEVLCRPCYRRFRMQPCDNQRCLTEISVDDVYSAIERLL